MTHLFIDKGVNSVKWTDSENKVHTCTEESYLKIFKQARDLDKEKKIDEIQGDVNEDEIKKEKEKDEAKKANMDLSIEELREIHKSLRAEFDELSNPYTDEDTDEDTQDSTKSASLEMTGVDNSRSIRSGSKLEHVGYDSNYSVLVYKSPSNESKDGDALLLKLGSSK